MASDVVDRFLSRAAARPNDIAISAQSGDMSYGALERRVRALAARFAQAREARILIALPPSADAYASMLASGMAGGFHTPVNLASPPEKLRKIASALDPAVIVGGGDVASKLAPAAPAAEIVDPATLDESRQFEGAGSRHRLAYVMFTSGSTGAPKGVMVSRAALAHYVAWLASMGAGPGDRLSQQPNLAFDISMTDVFGALCYGATLCPIETTIDRLTPARFIARQRITVWNSTPSTVSLMIKAGQLRRANVSSVRLFNFCGEPLLRQHLDAIFEATPHAIVRNTYGPTEATIAMTSLSLTAESYLRHCRASVALGLPIEGMDIALVGGPTAEEGELVIMGPQLADGYWKDPERTAQAFKQVSSAGHRLGYFTGDWVERCGGQLYFRERMDFQLKVRGHRVEADEVAAAIRDCGLAAAVVFKREEVLVALVERPEDGEGLDEPALQKALRTKLEAYAVPERIRMVDSIPRNENDKIDRQEAAALFERLIEGER